MSRVVLVDGEARRQRAALIVDGRLARIEIDGARPQRIGAVVAARTSRTLAGLGPAVRLEDGSEWLLDGKPGDGKGQGDGPFPVQLIRGPKGDKLGIASRSVSLVGRGLVHLPLESGVRFSRRLAEGWKEAKALEDALAERSGGWIVRRTAPQLAPEDLAAEAAALESEGARAAGGMDVPAPGAVRRLLADASVPPPDRILVSGAAAETALRDWCRIFAPSLVPRIERHRDSIGLFDAFDLEAEIARLRESHVPLAKGGSLVIEPTEALTAIDVNAGGETNPLAANLAATAEIARQIVLRHIGGLVVVDFVSMRRPADRARVTRALIAALADDPARTQILPMSNLGLVELARERRGPGLELDGWESEIGQ